MRIPAIFLIAVFLLSGAQTHAQSLASPPVSSLPGCRDPALTRPVQQNIISVQDSYPPLSVAMGEEGNSDVSFVLNANGTVSDVAIQHTSGSLRLDDAAVNAVRQLLYTPAKRAGVPVTCLSSLRIAWRLTGDSDALGPAEVGVLVIPAKNAWPANAVAKKTEGVTVVQVLVDPSGKIRTSRVGKSSGSEELDAASMAYTAKLHLKAGEVEGTPANTSFNLYVVWSFSPVKAFPPESAAAH